MFFVVYLQKYDKTVNYLLSIKLSMKKFLLSIFMLLTVLNFQLKADEGMWLPYNLSNQSLYEMQQLGCQLTPEQIFTKLRKRVALVDWEKNDGTEKFDLYLLSFRLSGDCRIRKW